MKSVPEKDWKRLQQLKPVVLDRFCERILREAISIANASGPTPHQRYLKLHQFIDKKDDDVARAFDDHRRSTALAKIMHIYKLGLFTDGEFAGFSEQTCKLVLELVSL
ncbi:MAG TPA: peptide ABC transporter substrate-binding protein [Verrucomicrobiae bacterium]|nr:peptide ABC transporter substrate-binding protein [Verrucomicrobiae bacterium]